MAEGRCKQTINSDDLTLAALFGIYFVSLPRTHTPGLTLLYPGSHYYLLCARKHLHLLPTLNRILSILNLISSKRIQNSFLYIYHKI